jgi:two-component system heavy metal sensor histidine kinase CusS
VRTRIADEVEKTIEFYEVLLEELGASVAITGDVDAQAPIEPALVRRALSNLVQNAIEHSRPGARISVEIRRGDGEVWVCVANPGEPIDEQHVKRLFDRFYRVDAARSLAGRPHGHGLGLAIVKAVATMHAGRVSATSRDGVTTIGFCIPAAPMAVPASAAPRAEGAVV